jgi:hypothetical protein
VVDSLVGENVLRPALERFGDFLIAAELLNQIPPLNFEREFSNLVRLKDSCGTATPSRMEQFVLRSMSLPQIRHRGQ